MGKETEISILENMDHTNLRITSDVIKEMQGKTTRRYHYGPNLEH